MSSAVRLQPLVRARVASLGEAGASWADALPGVIDRLADEWHLTWGRPLPGGSASYVVAATRGDEPLAVKVPLPDSAVEARTGEARLLAADLDKAASLHDLVVDLEGAPGGWVLVDPDGFREDPAYDLGVVLRDFATRLTGADGGRVLRGWCESLGSRTGVDPQRVWEWAFLERVSTGLHVLGLGADRVAAPFLASAAHLASTP